MASALDSGASGPCSSLAGDILLRSWARHFTNHYGKPILYFPKADGKPSDFPSFFDLKVRIYRNVKGISTSRTAPTLLDIYLFLSEDISRSHENLIQ